MLVSLIIIGEELTLIEEGSVRRDSLLVERWLGYDLCWVHLVPNEVVKIVQNVLLGKWVLLLLQRSR